MFATYFCNCLFMNHELIVTEPQGLSRSFWLICLLSGEHEVPLEMWSLWSVHSNWAGTCHLWHAYANWVLFTVHLPCSQRRVFTSFLSWSLLSVAFQPQRQSEAPEGGNFSTLRIFTIKTLREQLTTPCKVCYLLPSLAFFFWVLLYGKAICG